MSNKPIPSYVHGIFDYAGGLALLAAPEIFSFAHVGGPAVIIPRVLGIVIIVQSIFTDYEVGVVPALSMRMHLLNDYIASAFLALSPVLFGFHRMPMNAWLPHVVVGVAVFALTALTNPIPQKTLPKFKRIFGGV